MKPRPQNNSEQLELFRAQLSQILNPDHPLVLLASKIHWERFDEAFGPCFSADNGAPALPTRLVVGLLYLKHAFNLSDEALIDRWVENPYWQFFCGFHTMQHEPPIHPTSLVKWRNRIGAEKIGELLQETLSLAVQDKHIPANELKQVNVDTTVQEANIAFPTDSKLLHQAIVKLGSFAKKRGIPLRQSYRRVAQKAAIQVSRYAHAKQYKRMRRALKKLRTWTGRLIRDIRRKHPEPDPAFEVLLQKCERIHTQKHDDTKKLYSLHEPDTQCISKGKAHKRYEFGQKIAVATTNRGNWIVAAPLCVGNPFDGHTLGSTVKTIQKMTGVDVSDIYIDKGYRGHDYEGPAQVHVSGTSHQNLSGTTRKRRRRRSAIEPKIGHLKADHRLSRCFLRGLTGNAINAVLAAAGCNFLKLMRLLFLDLLRTLVPTKCATVRLAG